MIPRRVTARDGQEFDVDISDEACQEFGFRHGDSITIHGRRMGVVMGVALATEKGVSQQPKVLWFAINGYDGRVSYCFPLKEGCLQKN